MALVAIDPGSEQSAWLVANESQIGAFGICKNDDLITQLAGNWNNHLLVPRHLIIETLHVRGMPTAQEEMETQLWAGRFIQAAGLPFTQMRRIDVKTTLCGNARAKDGNIRQALIDRWGGKEQAVGSKKSPGPLYGISKDVWSALALAVTWFEIQSKIFKEP